ncbi:MAG: tripartite tricarboxylate transporter substrate binding protein [Deltaproteobacteria bacterium]|nr:tripartite tricarboxylate transporter substrate binding protein [Deltaproteobacteria bacterium]
MKRAPKKNTGIRALAIILALAFFVFAPVSQAAELAYPTRPIELVVSSEAGAFGDLGPRILNSKLPEILGVPIVISNKPHASGAAAVEAVVRAKPDGYTLLASANAPLTLVPLVNPQVPYTFRKLLPIAGYGYAFNGIVVRSDSPYKTLRDLVDFARKNPGKLTYGSTGAAHMSRISVELLKEAAGVDIVHVPYQGGAALRAAMLGGHVDLGSISLAVVLSLVKAGNLRFLVAFSENRLNELPEVPSVKELGYADSDLPTWLGFLAPVGTARPIIDKWNLAIQKALSDPGVKSQYEKVAITLDYKAAEKLADVMERESRILSEWVKKGGLTKK